VDADRIDAASFSDSFFRLGWFELAIVDISKDLADREKCDVEYRDSRWTRVFCLTSEVAFNQDEKSNVIDNFSDGNRSSLDIPPLYIPALLT
jgi:hypothetical protein